MAENIPFEIIELEPTSFHPIVKAQIEDTIINMILDTGASRTVLNRELLHNLPRINTPQQETFAAGINAQQLEVEQVLVPNIRIGQLEFTDMIVFGTDLQAVSNLYEQMVGMKIDGLLGCDFLEIHKATIDFKKRMIKLKDISLTTKQIS